MTSLRWLVLCICTVAIVALPNRCGTSWTNANNACKMSSVSSCSTSSQCTAAGWSGHACYANLNGICCATNQYVSRVRSQTTGVIGACSWCAAGKTNVKYDNTNVKLTSCDSCPSGKYKSSTTTGSCLACTSTCGGGKYLTGTCGTASTSNKQSCVSCVAGKYKAGTSTARSCSSCTSACGQGKYMSGTCPTGSSSNTVTCVNCQSGRYRSQTSHAYTSCVACTSSCGPGTYMSGTCGTGSTSNKVSCPTCQTGRYKAGTNSATSCDACDSNCPAGERQTATCPAGSTSDTVSCASVPCPAGSSGANVRSGCTCNQGLSGTITPTTSDPYFSGSCSDSQSPSVTVNKAASQASHTNNPAIVYDALFSEAVTDGEQATFHVQGPDPFTYTLAVTTVSSTQYRVQITLDAGWEGDVRVSLPAGEAHDAAGNGNSASSFTDNVVTYDVTSPQCEIESVPIPEGITSDPALQFTITCDEPVTEPTDVSVLAAFAGNAYASLSFTSDCGNNLLCATYTATVNIGNWVAVGSVSVGLPAAKASDAATNPTLASSVDAVVQFDSVPPTVTITVPAYQVTPDAYPPIAFTVTFSEPVSAFDFTHVVPSHGTPVVTPIAGTDSAYEVLLYDLGEDTVLFVSVVVEAGATTDIALNPNEASQPSPSPVIEYDPTTFGVIVARNATQTLYTNQSPIVFEVSFNKNINIGSFTPADVVVAPPTPALAVQVVGPVPDTRDRVFHVLVSGMVDDARVSMVIPSLKVDDVSGASNQESTGDENYVNWDVTPPAVRMQQDPYQEEPASSQPVLWRITLSEPLDFNTSWITWTNTGAASTLVYNITTTDNVVYELQVSGLQGEGQLTGEILAGTFTDYLGYPNTVTPVAAGLNTLVYDVFTQAPTLEAPLSFAAISAEDRIHFTLHEHPKLNTVRLVWAEETSLDPSAPHTVDLAVGTSGEYDLEFDHVTMSVVAPPLSSSYDCAAGVCGGLVPGAVYTLSVLYQDFRSNPVNSASSASVLFQPYITPGSAVCGPNIGSLSAAYCTQLQVAGNEIIQFSGVFDRPDGTGVVTVSYGAAPDTDTTLCVNDVGTPNTPNVITCRSGKGVGNAMSLQVVLASFGQTIFGADTIAYVPPSIDSQPFRRTVSTNPHENNMTAEVASGGDVLFFDGINWGDDPAVVRVTFAPVCAVNCKSDYVCPIVRQFFTPTTIACIAPPGYGGPNYFTVTAAGQASAPSAFTFEYPTTPIVYSITGCDPNPADPDGTANCPTTGLNSSGHPILLTITGQSFDFSANNGFGSVLSAAVGPSEAIVQQPLTQDTMYIYLPEGTGYNQPVLVRTGRVVSAPVRLVSYGAPSVVAILGCSGQGGNGPIGCNRATQPIITIFGKNFGPENAKVLVGGLICNSPVHSTGTYAAALHEKLTCILPQAKGVNLLVVVGQYNGQFTVAPVTVSYKECPSGSFDGSGLACQTCPPGAFSPVASSTACFNCTAGKYAPNAGQSECFTSPAGSFVDPDVRENPEECLQGTYAPVESSQCFPCFPGRANGQTGRGQCAPCSKGTFSNESNALTCQACEPGKYADELESSSCGVCSDGSVADTALGCSRCLSGRYAVNAMECRVCSAGRYMNLAEAVGCLPCPPGRAQSSEGQNSCVECTAGFAQPEEGKFSCEPCQPGRFSASPRQTECLLCPAGTAVNSTQQFYCPSCLAGSRAEVPGQVVCELCPAGTFASVPRSQTCVPCPPGFSANLTGQEACESCVPGTHTSTPGQLVCEECAPGTFASSYRSDRCVACDQGSAVQEAGSSSCEACIPGKFSLRSESQQCQECSKGRYSNTYSASECVECDLGSYANETGARSCVSCALAHYADSPGQQKCLPCPAGTFANELRFSRCQLCPLGRVAPQTGSSSCMRCEPGKIAAEEGRPTCSTCEPGKFAAAAGAEVCELCPLGKAGANSSSSECSDCIPGRFSKDLGTQQCQDCSAGETSNQASAECSPCEGNSVNPWSGSGRCYRCDRNSVANTQQTDCTCSRGWYGTRRAEDQAEFKCLGCPEGGDCTQTGTTRESLGSLKGWWRPSENTTTFHRCLRPTHCQGGKNQCAAFREGPLCSGCIKDYQRSSVGGRCSRCPTRTNSILFSVLISVAVLVGVMVVYYFVLRDTATSLARMEEEEQSGSIAERTEGSRDLDFETSASSTSLSVNAKKKSLLDVGLGDGKKRLENEVTTANSRHMPNYMYKVKIMVSFFQIASTSTFTAGVAFPSLYLAFLANFQFLNFDFVPWQTLACATQLDYLIKATVVGIIPLAFLACVVAFFFIPNYLLDRRDFADQNTYRNKRRLARVKFWKLTLFTTFCLYPHVSSTIVGVYNCIDVQGSLFLTNDMRILCTSTRWTHYALGHIIFMIMYPVGVPVAYLLVLMKHRRDFATPLVRVKLGFLYDAYSTSFWFFELVDMTFKLGMTSIIAFLPNWLELQASMVVVAVYIIFLLVFRPYVRKGDDRFHLLSLNGLLLVALMGNVISATGAVSTLTDILLSLLLIALSILIVIVCLIMSVRNLRKRLRFFQRDRTLAKQRASGIAVSLSSLNGDSFMAGEPEAVDT